MRPTSRACCCEHGSAPTRAAPTAPQPSTRPAAGDAGALDRLLRFTGGAEAAAATEDAFERHIEGVMATGRTAVLAFLCLIYAAVVAVVFATHTVGTSAPIGASVVVPVCLFFACAVLIPAVRIQPANAAASGPGAAAAQGARCAAGRDTHWYAALAADVATAVNVLGTNPDYWTRGMPPDAMSASGLMLFALIPICGIGLMPRWRVFAAVCAVHAARAVPVLLPLGPGPHRGGVALGFSGMAR